MPRAWKVCSRIYKMYKKALNKILTLIALLFLSGCNKDLPQENHLVAGFMNPGKWQVARFVCSKNGQQLIAASPNSRGLFIDFLDPEATRAHFEYIFKQLGLVKGVNNNTQLKTLDDDSMELYRSL
jgi:hypothetical protein